MLRRAPTFDTVRSRRVLGVFAIAFALLVGVIATLRPNPFADTRSVWVEFDSVQGLGSIDRDVRIAGANSGKIGEVERRGDDALVELVIDDDVPVRADATAAMRPHTLFEGSVFVDLGLGSPSAPPLGEDDVIPKSRSRVYVSLDTALRALSAPARKSLRELVDTAARTLTPDAVDGLRRTLHVAPQLTRELGPTARALRGPRGDELGDAITGLAKTVDAVSSRRSVLRPLVQRTNATLAAADPDGGGPLDAALRELPGPIERIAASGDRFYALVDRTDRIAVRTRPVARALTPLLREARPIMKRAPGVVRDATPLIGDLRIVLQRAAAAAPVLFDLLNDFEPGAKLLNASVIPYLNGDSRLGIPRYMQLIAGFTAGAGVSRSYQTEAQNPLGGGHFQRLGGYFDVEGTAGGVTKPSCAAVAVISQDAADQLEQRELCAP